MNSINKRLKEARLRIGMKQDDAAKAMGMSRPTLSAIEAGKRELLARELVGFADLYRVDVKSILYEESSISRKEINDMDYEQFKKQIEEDLHQALADHGINASISEHHVEKLNSSYDALSVTPEGSNIGVNANLDSMFQAVQDGHDYSEVLDKAADSLIASIQNMPQIDVADLTNYEEMKHKLSMQVVSADRNAEMLQNVPHKQMEDMAVVYRLVLSEGKDDSSTVLVTNDLMEQFGITHEQLHEDAMVNAPGIRPAQIRGMTETMNDLMGPGMVPEIDPADEMMFVAGVPSQINGAGVIAYPNFFEDAAEKLGGDYFVLPSSIHEVLLVKDTGEMNARDLEAMVREVNATEVAPDERLTDHVYHYDSKDHVFEMADKFEERQAEKTAEEIASDRGSLLDDLKSKKDEVAKDAPEKHARDAVKKSRGGEAL